MQSASTARSNADFLRQMDAAMARGDMRAFFDCYAADVVVHLGGNNKLACDYHGLDQLQATFGRFMEASGGYSFQNYSYFADEERGVILQRGTMTRNGETFSTDEAFVYTFRDGKISEFWYLPFNQAGVDAWWGK